MPRPTLASSLFMRELRLTVLAPVLQLIDENPDMVVRTFTMIHPNWAFSAEKLPDVNARRIKNQFRTHLNRGGVTASPGFLLAFLHGEFEPIGQEFQLHFHGICGGEKVHALDRLRQQQGYMRTPTIYRPLVIQPIRDLARQVSYILQSFWPERARVEIGTDRVCRRERTKRRIAEPYHSLYLLWLDRWTLSDLRLANGIKFGGDMLEIVNAK